MNYSSGSNCQRRRSCRALSSLSLAHTEKTKSSQWLLLLCREAIKYNEDGGLLYSTIDDFHYKSASID